LLVVNILQCTKIRRVVRSQLRFSNHFLRISNRSHEKSFRQDRLVESNAIFTIALIKCHAILNFVIWKM
jgi:hypothetical protein